METKRTFGTAPVFFTAIATILGAILFLRFGFAVGQVGFLGAIAIIIIGHAVTIPTAMAIAEIATNQKVEGGGEYYIISRSFGLVIGSTIGIALYFSQAISVAFYIMAFSEAFTPFFNWLNASLPLPRWLEWIFMQKQFIGIPALLLLTYVMLTRGAKLGLKILYGVVAILAISLLAFFIGNTDYARENAFNPVHTISGKIDENSKAEDVPVLLAGIAIHWADSIEMTLPEDPGQTDIGQAAPTGVPAELPAVPGEDISATGTIADSMNDPGAEMPPEPAASAQEQPQETPPAEPAGTTGQETPTGSVQDETSTGNGEEATGSPSQAEERKKERDPEPVIPVGFFIVFAIIFPAFTGMTAGVGLSGDLKDPGKSIPLGTLAATLFGMVMYVLISYKLAKSAPPEILVDTSRLVMADIAWMGFLLIPAGLAAATFSSALGSIMVAPRTLQAIGRDNIFPATAVNNWVSEGRGEDDEPFNASMVTVVIAGGFIIAGVLNGVAQIISMFFMVTYGSLCLLSFLNHFAGDPAYRPKFKSRWYLSLFGAVSCVALMFLMNPGFAILSLIMISLLFLLIGHYNQEKSGLAVIFQGAIFQFSRQIHVFLQKSEKEQIQSWRPSAIAIVENTFEQLSAFELLTWLSHRYGFGTYVHHIKGYLSKDTNQEAIRIKERLIKMAEASGSHVFMHTLVSPSFTSTISQVIQLPSIAGTENNLLLFEFHKDHPDKLEDMIDNFGLIQSVNFDLLLLGSSERGFGLRKHIHIWLTPYDYQNANLMILLAYIMLGNRDWKRATISIFAIFPEGEVARERERLSMLIQTGQLPISPNNIEFISRKQDTSLKTIINEKSYTADLTILGFVERAVEHGGLSTFQGYDELGNVLFVNATESKKIK